MDSDEFDDDFADEDFITALDQVSSSNSRVNNSLHSSESHGTALKNSSAYGACQDGADFDIELENIPSDAFSSQEHVQKAPAPRTGLARSSSGSFRQTTLWGTDAAGGSQRASQSATARVYRADLPPEAPSQHELDQDAMKTWVYPMNLGAIRDYQFSIVKNSLFNNTLVALPTLSLIHI